MTGVRVGHASNGPREKGYVVLRVVAVDVLVTEQRDELPAEDLEIPAGRRVPFLRLGAGGREELDETLGVARQRDALRRQLAHDAEHGVRRQGRRESLERILTGRVRGHHAQRGARETLSQGLREPHDQLGGLPGGQDATGPGQLLQVGRCRIGEPDQELSGRHTVPHGARVPRVCCAGRALGRRWADDERRGPSGRHGGSAGPRGP